MSIEITADEDDPRCCFGLADLIVSSGMVINYGAVDDREQVDGRGTAVIAHKVSSNDEAPRSADGSE